MAIYKTFDAILQDGDYSDNDAMDYANGMVWDECEVVEQSIGYARYVDTVNEVGVYYDYAADYYFFTDES